MRTQNPSGQNRRSLFRAENSKFLGLTRFIALLVLLALPGAARAAGITWGVNTTISADTDVLTNGTPVFAFTWLSPAPTTVNGVSFTNSPALAGNTSNLVITSSSGLSSFATFGQGAAGTPYAALSSAYKAVIVGGTYVTAAPLTCTLNSLTVGRAYAVQVWVDDSRTLAVARTEVLTNAGGVPVTLNFNVNQVATAGNVGQFAIGIFTADNTNQAFTISGNAASQINGMQLRDVTGTGYMPPLQTIVTWNGGSTTNSNWSDAANWNGMIVQSNVTVVSGTFTGTTRQTNANDVTGLILKKITLSTSNWDVTGNPVTLNGSLSATAAGVSTWELDTLLSATPTISQTATGGVLNLTGVYSGSGGLTVASGAGAVTLSNPNNSFTGAVNVQGGTLNYASLAPGGQNSSLGAGTSKINVGTAGSASAFNYVGTASGAMDRGLFLTGNSTGGVTLNNNSANNSSLAFNADTLLTNATAGNVMTLNLGGVASGTTTFNGQLENANTSIGYFNGNLNVTGPGTWVFNNFIWFTNNVNIGTNTHFVLGVVGSNPNSSMLVNNIALNPGGVFDVSAYSQPAPFILGAYASFPQTMTAGRPDGTSATDINGNFALGGAALSIAGNGVPGTLTINGSFAPATSAGTSVINFDFGSTTNVGAAVSDLIQINGNLDLSQGVATVNLNPYQTSLQYNTPYTLISYTGSLNGNASGLAAPIFDRAHTGIISTATPNVVTVTFNASGNSPANHLLWQGYGGNANWDIDTTSNWLNAGTLTDYFYPGDSVFFDDTASQFNVNLVGNIMPGVVTVTNNANAYTFSGGLAGVAASLVKQGAGTLTLTGTNTYGGGTLVSGGTLALATGNAVGSGTVTNNSIISIVNPNSLASVTFNTPIAGAGIINLPASEFVQFNGANALTNFAGTINVPNGGSLWVTNTASPATINVQGAGNGGEAALQVDGVTLSGPVNLLANNTLLGVTAGASGTINGNISDGGQGYGVTVNGNGTLILGGTNTYTGLTTVNASGISGGLTFNNPASIAGNVYVNGFGSGGSAFGGGVIATIGTNVVWPAGKTLTLDNTVGRASLKMNPNSSMYGNILIAGNVDSTLNVVSILPFATNASSPNLIAGNISLTGGSSTTAFYIRGDNGAGATAQTKITGNLNIGNGNLNVNSGILTIASTGNVWSRIAISGTVINGVSDALCPTGLLYFTTATPLDLAGYNQTIAGVTNPAAMASVIDGNASQSGTPNNNTLTINVPSGTNYAFNGVVKNTYGKLSVVYNGPGTQTLSGTNAYTGNTTVNGGTLSLSQATLATNSTITIASGAALNLGFTTTNKVNALVLNGVNQPSGVVYNNANTGGLITGTGSLLVVPLVATNPTNLTATVSSGNLNLAWPADHTGWRLLMQTNNLSAGVSANTNDWTTVAGSANTNQVSLPVNAAQPTEFYRLVYP